MLFCEKLRLILKTERRTQAWLSEKTGISKRTIENYISGTNEPTISKVQEIAKLFPQYALWLLTDKIDLPEHTSPEIELRKEMGG